ncbi:MAG: PH domain-containing protein, partial [Actinomycetota bacterium]|nr:PH domain-containing protein [Actinomycetota bacterium]
LLFRLHRWEVTDDAVYTLSGWIVREWRIAPISRVQTVDTEHGPVQQMLKLATVTVTTASARGPVKIAGLADGDARELARTLTETTQAHPGDAT